MNTTLFTIVDFRRVRVGQMVHFILRQFLKRRENYFNESDWWVPIFRPSGKFEDRIGIRKFVRRFFLGLVAQESRGRSADR